MPANRKYEGPYRARPIGGNLNPDGTEREPMWSIVHLISTNPVKYEDLLPPRTFTGRWARQSANRACKNLNIQWKKAYDAHSPFRQEVSVARR